MNRVLQNWCIGNARSCSSSDITLGATQCAFDVTEVMSVIVSITSTYQQQLGMSANVCLFSQRHNVYNLMQHRSSDA